MAAGEQSSHGDWVRSAVLEFEGPLTRYAVRLLGDVERARDVVQDTFLRLCGQPRGAVDGHLTEWLFTVCRNRALDVRRKESRMTAISDEQVASRQSSQPAPPDVAELKDSASSILKLLGTLPTNQQEVIRLKFQNGLSYKEIANVTDLTVGNVGFLLHTAIKTLRQKLTAPLPAVEKQWSTGLKLRGSG